MNRFNFIRSVGLAIIPVPIIALSTSKQNLTSFASKDNPSSRFFPDRENYLIQAYCVFATPTYYGDGKNGDDSYVDAIVDIGCYDYLYNGRGVFLDNTEIENNVIRNMPIGFSASDAQKIFFDGITNVTVTILGNKPNQNETTNDKWNLRWEFVMEFKKGQVLSSGGDDPAPEYHFKKGQTKINRNSVFPRAQMRSGKTIKNPIG